MKCPGYKMRRMKSGFGVGEAGRDERARVLPEQAVDFVVEVVVFFVAGVGEVGVGFFDEDVDLADAEFGAAEEVGAVGGEAHATLVTADGGGERELAGF